MGLELSYNDDQTPLNDEEKEGLRIVTITTTEELNEFEQQNIEEAMLWLVSKKLKPEVILTEKFLKDLHYKMYAKTWKWAGEFRKTEKNIGVNYWKISTELKILLDDCLFWIYNKTYEPDETAIRFKHRLVSIHCFPNGNGRHSRLIADVIIEKIFKKTLFTWGQSNLSNTNPIRIQYIKALKTADLGNVLPLILFSRQ